MAAARRRRLALGLVSAAGHGALVLWLVAARPAEAPLADPPAMSVTLVTRPPPPKPESAPDPKATPEPKPAPPKPSKAKAARLAKARPTPVARQMSRPPPLIAVRSAGPSGPGASDAEMGEADLAGAATAGGGGSGAGAGCDMAGRLQRALRKDRRVQEAVAEVHRGRALRVWNGAWVRHPGQEGAGLTAVREAILWEVGFAPEACRSAPVRGLVVVSLADGPGAARLALGAGTWRWKDLLFSRAGRN